MGAASVQYLDCGLISAADSTASMERLSSAQACLATARAADTPEQRFVAAHMAALRAASAILVLTGRPQRGRGARNVWAALHSRAPEFANAADRLAGQSARRVRIQAGLSGETDSVNAAALLEVVEAFVAEAAEFVYSA